MTSLITWFTNISTIRSHWFSRPGWDLTHLLTKSRFVVWTSERWEKCTSIFHPSCWDGTGYLFKHTLWLHASEKLAQEVHSLAAAPRGPENIHRDSKHSGEWSVFLGKLLSQRFGMISVGYARNITAPPLSLFAALLLCSRCAVRSHPLLA